MARPWAIPGTPGLEHRVGGLEHEHGTGNVSYNPKNHELMTEIREEKLARIANDIPLAEVVGPDDADVLVVGWGSTFGAIRAGVMKLRDQGHKVGQVHLRHLNPLPADLGEILGRYRQVVVPEVNFGQLLQLLRARYLVDAKPIDQLRGRPFREGEMVEALSSFLGAK